MPITRALLSVHDKSGLVELASVLADSGVELVSSGGTADALRNAGLELTSVEDVTGHPEMLGGRVKTLHPAIHGGILADQASSDHRADLARCGIEPFQLVVVSLYPFAETLAGGGTRDELIEMIDIGGPTMIRAAAKNQGSVAVVVSPDQYPALAESIVRGGTTEQERAALARRAFFETATYDAAIVGWLEGDQPERRVLALERAATLRYGENPHQQAGLYSADGGGGWWRTASQLQGKEMSFNNYLDAEAAWHLASAFADPTAVVVKHTNPCGVASRAGVGEALAEAWACDPLSAFGGVVALNRPLDAAAAAVLSDRFVEIVMAPAVEDDAGSALSAKQNLRLLIGADTVPGTEDWKALDGAFLRQERDSFRTSPEWSVVSQRQPTRSEAADAEFAWTVAAHVKSNAVVVAAQRAAVGVGAGDQSRVGAAERALARAGTRAAGATAASDAFFPFTDGLEVLVAGGVTCVVEPGGSRRDDEVIAAADRLDAALIFTHERHFRH